MTQPRLVGGRYELGELIGYGGMAEVHRGRDIRLGRDVAIKILRPDLARDPSFLNRFRREAQAAAGLNHPSIVSVYDTGEDAGPDGTVQPFIVMEYVEGRTLRDILKSEGRLPARRAMEITADVCGALDFSHRNGLVHRDIKPANVMITRTGAVKVMDFGIARAVADNAATVTQTANVIGTAQYLSPEQARGEAVDARSDVYSTGCLLYELVTGVPPFQGDSPVAVAYQHVRENASAPSSRNPELPRALDSIVMKALAKNQLNRYQTAGEMRSDLQRALADQPVNAEAVMTDAERTQFIARTPPPPLIVPPEDLDQAHERDHDRHTAFVWLAVVIALLLVVGGTAFAIIKLRNDGTKAPPKVALPSVIGDTLAAAQTAFKTVNLKLEPNPTGSTTFGPTCDDGNNPTPKDVGLICKLTQANQTVLAGASVEQESTVFYQTYTQQKIQVPGSLTGQTYPQAAALLMKDHLNPQPRKRNSATTAGLVLGSNPPAFTEVTPGTVITLFVSTGNVKLKDVTGELVGTAKSDLNAQGFTQFNPNKFKTTHDESKNDRVASEDPTPGIAYPLSTAITLTVYHFVALPPTCTTGPPPSSPSGPASPPGGDDNPHSPSAPPSGSGSSSGLPPCT
jgi:serine/threonine-protein kinase